ncbi:hypothetical protein MON38_05780 [Hymenobacter sp. DH14]|uniref:Secretion system C-terminal sorting domain-containing protein n=2 Tax=Hymenobacter cyanobacteriorum TaxID=2926463 RepID=A0A9X2AEL6_9BACT|nr:hypothetical protein [Hymenobacter cyanobacteriorum]
MVEAALEQAHHSAGLAPVRSGSVTAVAATPRKGSLPGAAASRTPGYSARQGTGQMAGRLFRGNATGAPRWPAEAPATASGTFAAPGSHPGNSLSNSSRSLAVAGSGARPAALAGPPAGRLPEELLVALARPQLPLVQLFPLPSPCPDTFDVDFRLAEPADVRLDLVDARGRKVLGIIRRRLTGNSAHRISLLLAGLGLPPGAYTCQLHVLGA